MTHVVTSRPIPEVDVNSPVEPSPASGLEHASMDGPIQTVNPSLLERTDIRREQGNGTDVLHRARQMGMKIWAIEKLQRMLSAIHGADTPPLYPNGRGNGTLTTKGRGDTELSQVLRNELHGPSDRDPSTWMKDMALFKGLYIYVHDMDEKTRPVMVREYAKVSRRQDGPWPQFRSAPLGKCPFIDEPPSKKELAKMKDDRKKPAVGSVITVPNAAKKVERPEPSNEIHRTPPENEGMFPPSKVEESVPTPTTQVDAPKVFPVRPVSSRKSSESFIAPTLTRTGPFHLGREPAASGVQPSNITSAIRSQMISSTAAAPGAKTGLSKEVHELKRKVLERSNGSLSTSANPSSHRTVDIPTIAKPAAGMSSRSKRPADKLVHIHEEDTTQSEDNGGHKQQSGERKSVLQKKSKEKKRDPKPGYCENCRDKFDDFDEV